MATTAEARSIKESVHRNTNYDTQETALIAQVMTLAYSRHSTLKGNIHALIELLKEEAEKYSLVTALTSIVKDCTYVREPWVRSTKSLLLRDPWSLAEDVVAGIVAGAGGLDSRMAMVHMIREAMRIHEEERKAALVKAAERAKEMVDDPSGGDDSVQVNETLASHLTERGTLVVRAVCEIISKDDVAPFQSQLAHRVGVWGHPLSRAIIGALYWMTLNEHDLQKLRESLSIICKVDRDTVASWDKGENSNVGKFSLLIMNALIDEEREASKEPDPEEVRELIAAVTADESFEERDLDYWVEHHGDNLKALSMLTGRPAVICGRALAILAMAYEEKLDDELISLFTINATR